MLNFSCKTITAKSWPYEQYIIGNTDNQKIRHDQIEIYWSGAKSLENYSGQLLFGNFHGVGTYHWQGKNPDRFLTYEGHFYCNRMHGEGTLSYSNGRVFEGLFYSNIRWGPGIESHVDLRQNVGLWLGKRLIRLAWRPPALNLILDLMTTNTGRACVNTQRNLMATCSETVNESDKTIELLTKFGADTESAKALWTKLYPNHITDFTSPIFRTYMFDENYYCSDNKDILVEIEKTPDSIQSISENKYYYAWNNNGIIKHMMKQTYVHRNQLMNKLNIGNVISDSRENLKAPAKHELDCRTLLMASYLGLTETVVQLINEHDVHPDVTDVQGNNPLIYATCGNHTELIHFLVEAGADVNGLNDSCCTALGLALARFICQYKGLTLSDMTQALIPESALQVKSSLNNIVEWKFTNGNTPLNNTNGTARTPSKLLKAQMSHRRVKSLLSLKDQFTKTNYDISEKAQEQDHASENKDLSESLQLYTYTKNKYILQVTQEYSVPGKVNPVPYIFEVKDISNIMADSEIEEQKKTPEKNPKKVPSKALKEQINGKGKLTHELPTIPRKEIGEQSSAVEQTCTESCEKIFLTINQLLIDGADPSLVKCPQAALFMAVASGCSELVKLLIQHGENVNKLYPHLLGYSVLDIAISYPLTNENLAVVHVLLENGADAKHRLPYRARNSNDSMNPGPTLLHAVLSKTIDSENEEEIRKKLLILLLAHNCDSLAQFNGRSAVDLAMSKRPEVFNVFIEHPKVNLNAVINHSNQNILIKFLSLTYFKTVEKKQRLETLTNLLRHGADPLCECQIEQENFKNIFVYTQKFLDGYENVEMKRSPIGKKQSEHNMKKNGKGIDERTSKQKVVGGDIDEYKQALELVADWTRHLYINQLRTKILNGLIKITKKYKHRHWSMILNNAETKKRISLWLTLQNVFDILSSTLHNDKEKCIDKMVLKYLLCIIVYSCRNKGNARKTRITVTEKDFIESEVNTLLKTFKLNILPIESKSWLNNLCLENNTKYNVCFECFLPLNNEKVLCPLCQDIAFCTETCMNSNTQRLDFHSCNEDLRKNLLKVFNTEV